MKLLIISSTLPYSDNDPVPAFVKDQAENFAKHCTDTFSKVVVIAPHHKPLSLAPQGNKFYKEYRFNYFWPTRLQQIAGRGIMPAIEEKKWRIIQVPFLFIAELINLYQVTKKEKPDLIYAHWFTPQGINAAIVSGVTKTPFVFTSHSSDVLVWKKIPFLGKYVVRYFSQKALACTVVSKRSMEKIRCFFSDENWSNFKHKVGVIPMGVDIASFSRPRKQQVALKKEYGLEDKTVILFLGRLEEKKGVQYLLPAFARLRKTNPNLHLIVAGDGHEKMALMNLATTLNLNKAVTFTGYVSGVKKNDYLHLADILTVPSIITKGGDAEGLPVVLMEGLASKKLCIATDVSGADDIITHKKNGLVIKSEDSGAIATAINELLSMNKGEQDKIKQEARKLAQSLDWSVIVKRHRDFFMEEIENQ